MKDKPFINVGIYFVELVFRKLVKDLFERRFLVSSIYFRSVRPMVHYEVISLTHNVFQSFIIIIFSRVIGAFDIKCKVT